MYCQCKLSHMRWKGKQLTAQTRRLHFRDLRVNWRLQTSIYYAIVWTFVPTSCTTQKLIGFELSSSNDDDWRVISGTLQKKSLVLIYFAGSTRRWALHCRYTRVVRSRLFCVCFAGRRDLLAPQLRWEEALNKTSRKAGKFQWAILIYRVADHFLPR